MTVPPIITILKPELARETAKEPAKRWRNWWRAHYGGVPSIRVDGDIVPDGGVFSDPGGHPSKEVAEQFALDCLDDITRQLSRPHWWSFWRAKPRFDYLRALPEGERP